jgi:hypothetical protein
MTNANYIDNIIEKQVYQLSCYLDNNKFRENEATSEIHQYSRDDRCYLFYTSYAQLIYAFGKDFAYNFVKNKNKNNKKKIQKFWHNLMFTEIKKCIAAENTRANINVSILVSEIRKFFDYIVNDRVHKHYSDNVNYIYDFKDEETDRNALINAIFYNLTDVVKELAKYYYFEKVDLEYAIQNNANDEIINIIKNNIEEIKLTA